MTFERIIAVDWSGAGTEKKTNNGLAVAVWSAEDRELKIQPPTPRKPRTQVNWRRTQLLDWLGEELAPDKPRSLVLLDFPFSFPYGTATAWGAGEKWEDLVRFIARNYSDADPSTPARAVTEHLGSDGSGPFRRADRCSTSWYLANGVGYYRATELAVSQALSEFYAGPGAQVALGALAGISNLDRLMRLRREGKAAFEVWPFEIDGASECDTHILAETYPALFPYVGGGRNSHEDDALRVGAAVSKAAEGQTLDRWFEVPEVPFGRYADVRFREQIQFEGWIFGIRAC